MLVANKWLTFLRVKVLEALKELIGAPRSPSRGLVGRPGLRDSSNFVSQTPTLLSYQDVIFWLTPSSPQP